MITTKSPFQQMSFKDYRAIDAVNQSSLKWIANESPKHYRWYKDNPGSETRSQGLGTLAHSLTLEPEVMLDTYIVMPTEQFEAEARTQEGEVPRSPRATTDYKSRCKQFREENPGKIIIERPDYELIKNLSREIWRHEEASVSLARARHRESVITWIDKDSGLRCKARLDAVDDSRDEINDINTTQDILKFSFGKFCYDIQAAFYIDGYETEVGRKPKFRMTVGETKPPYCVQSTFVSDATIAAGRARYRRALLQLRECLETNHWPGPKDPQSWTLSDWEINKHLDECV